MIAGSLAGGATHDDCCCCGGSTPLVTLDALADATKPRSPKCDDLAALSCQVFREVSNSVVSSR